MNFEEFLKERILNISFLGKLRGLSTRHYFSDGVENTKIRFIEELGEWAWVQFKEDGQRFAKSLFGDDSLNDSVHWQARSQAWGEIAKACLGKKEYKKRLTILQEKR